MTHSYVTWLIHAAHSYAVWLIDTVALQVQTAHIRVVSCVRRVRDVNHPSIERVETFGAEKILAHEITWIRNEVKSEDQAICELKSLD